MVKVEFETAIKDDELDLTGKSIFVELQKESYMGIANEVLEFIIEKAGEEFQVRQIEENEPIVFTEAGYIYFYLAGINVYFPSYWDSVPLEDRKIEQEVLHASKAVIVSRYKFGGPAPYSVLIKGIFVDDVQPDRNALPIGQAVIGESLIIG